MKKITTHYSLGSQCGAILARLERTPGRWVSLLDLFRVSESMNVCNRIRDLREVLRPQGFEIENKISTGENQGGRMVKRSFYRLVEREASYAS